MAAGPLKLTVDASLDSSASSAHVGALQGLRGALAQRAGRARWAGGNLPARPARADEREPRCGCPPHWHLGLLTRSLDVELHLHDVLRCAVHRAGLAGHDALEVAVLYLHE